MDIKLLLQTKTVTPETRLLNKKHQSTGVSILPDRSIRRHPEFLPIDGKVA
jgi:hypothetical protein